MNCPECNSTDIMNIYEDNIPCGDCGSTIKMEYFMCGACGYNFRNNNGSFMDGSYAFAGAEILKELTNFNIDWEEAAKELMDDPCNGCHGCDSHALSDFVFNCVKCGKAIVADPDEIKYSCPHCGFEWEILGDG